MRRARTLLLALAALGLALAGALRSVHADPQAESDFYEALTGYMIGEAGNPADAAVTLLRVGVRSGDGELLRAAAQYARQAGQQGLALTIGKRWVALDDSPDANTFVAESLIGAGQFAEARPYLGRLVDRRMVDPAAYRRLLSKVWDREERIAATMLFAERYPEAGRDAGYHGTLARLYRDVGLGREALAAAEAAAEAEPESLQAAAYHVELLLERDFGAARERLGLLVSAHGIGSGEFLRLVAQVHLSAHAQENLDLMRRSYFRKGMPAEDLYHLARMALFANDPGLATEYLVRAVESEPGRAEASMLLAFLLLQDGQVDRALEALGRLAGFRDISLESVVTQFSYYRLALVAVPSAPMQPGELFSASDLESYRAGLVYRDIGKDRMALKTLSKIGVESGLHVYAQSEIARILAERGDRAAVDSILRHLRLEYADDARRFSTGRDLLMHVEIAEAEVIEVTDGKRAAMDFLLGRADRYGNPRPLLYRASFFAEDLGDYDLAERFMRRYVSLPPEGGGRSDPNGDNALGYLLADHNRHLAEARTLIERALQSKPADPNIIDSLGWVQYRQGQLEDARATLIRAARLSMAAEIHAHLGEVLWKLGDRANASEIWKRALYLHPDNKTLLETVERLGPL